jgi:hypothetical protein
MRISLEETVADCSGLPAGSTDSCTISKTLLEDVVPGSCTVSATGTCEYTTTFNSTSLGHKVANGHRSSIAITEIKVVDAVSNADAFETGVLLK